MEKIEEESFRFIQDGEKYIGDFNGGVKKVWLRILGTLHFLTESFEAVEEELNNNSKDRHFEIKKQKRTYLFNVYKKQKNGKI